MEAIHGRRPPTERKIATDGGGTIGGVTGVAAK